MTYGLIYLLGSLIFFLIFARKQRRTNKRPIQIWREDDWLSAMVLTLGWGTIPFIIFAQHSWAFLTKERGIK
jgi:hypothetical protein